VKTASPGEIRASMQMVNGERSAPVYERYGFEPVDTPLIEYTDALGKFLPDQDRPNEGVFSLQDDDEQWLSLRYDLTAPLARYVAENFEKLPKPYPQLSAAGCSATRSPAPAASASSCSSTPTRSAPASPPTPRCA
jgi:histidyl-tRNA synthetase